MTGQDLQKIITDSDIKVAEIIKKSTIPERTFYSLYEKDNIPLKYLEKIKSAGVKIQLPDTINKSDKNQNCIFVPLKAIGGFLAGYENKVYLDELERFAFNQIKGECFCFEVEGSSMCRSKVIDGEIFEAGYKPGSFVVATKVENIDWLSKHKDYVFQTTDGLIIKRYEKIKDDKFVLTSINEEYNPVPPIPVKAVKGIYFIEKKIS